MLPQINDDGSYTAQLTFAPVLEEAELDAPRNYEFIFVVDRCVHAHVHVTNSYLGQVPCLAQE